MQFTDNVTWLQKTSHLFFNVCYDLYDDSFLNIKLYFAGYSRMKISCFRITSNWFRKHFLSCFMNFLRLCCRYRRHHLISGERVPRKSRELQQRKGLDFDPNQSWKIQLPSICRHVLIPTSGECHHCHSYLWLKWSFLRLQPNGHYFY